MCLDLASQMPKISLSVKNHQTDDHSLMFQVPCRSSPVASSISKNNNKRSVQVVDIWQSLRDPRHWSEVCQNKNWVCLVPPVEREDVRHNYLFFTQKKDGAF